MLYLKNYSIEYVLKLFKKVVVFFMIFFLFVGSDKAAKTQDSITKYKPPIIIAVDGLAIREIGPLGVELFKPIMGKEPNKYLGGSLMVSTGINAMKAEIKPYTWKRDPAFTDTQVQDLKENIIQAYEVAKNDCRPLVIVAHSWGSVLAYKALIELAEEEEVKVDSFITMGSPLDLKSRPVPDLVKTFMMIEKIKEGLPDVKEKPKNVRCDWINLWAERDYFSNKIIVANENLQIDENNPRPSLILSPTAALGSLANSAHSGDRDFSTPMEPPIPSNWIELTKEWHKKYFMEKDAEWEWIKLDDKKKCAPIMGPHKSTTPIMIDYKKDCIPVPSKISIWMDKKVPEKIKECIESQYTIEGQYTKGCLQGQYTKGLATALVMDVSGSMGWESGSDTRKKKINDALNAVEVYFNGAQDDEYLSLSTFASNGETPIPISSKDEALKDLSSLAVSIKDWTNIGAGLKKGYSELSNENFQARKKIAILLSDGVNNKGDWRPIVEDFKNQQWKIYTIGFLTDEEVLKKLEKKYGQQIPSADYSVFSKTLFEIAAKTKGVFYPAASENIDQIFDRIRNLVSRESSLLYVSEWLKVGGELSYKFGVSKGAEIIKIFTSIAGSKLGTVIISPDGIPILPEKLSGIQGRYEEGKTYQLIELNSPQSGQWMIKAKWAEPPPGEGEQVNISITEKSDVLANLLAFKPKYNIGEPVDIAVYAVELKNDEEKILENAKVTVEIKKAGPEMIRMVQAQSTNWTMYKDVMLDITRDIGLFDDGAHNDYKAGDGIFGNTFNETDKNGAYLVTAIIKGKKQNGEKVEKILQGSFQVGPISQNAVTTSQILQYTDQAQSHIENTTPYKEESFSKPAQEIDRLQGNPLDSINKLLKENK
jgi:hypothetical protein